VFLSTDGSHLELAHDTRLVSTLRRWRPEDPPEPRPRHLQPEFTSDTSAPEYLPDLFFLFLLAPTHSSFCFVLF
jgi:hypothetical protein